MIGFYNIKRISKQVPNIEKGGTELRVTEQNVVQQIKYKNEDSISYVLQSYGGLLNTIIRKYLQGNQQDIEECLADVLVSIWFHINSFDSTKMNLNSGLQL